LEAEGYGTAWRAEPIFLDAPVKELHEYLGNADEIDGAVLLRWLETRSDDATRALGRLAQRADPRADSRADQAPQGAQGHRLE